MFIRRRSEKIDLLRKVPLFESLSKRQLNEIAKHADDVAMHKGQILAREGKLGWELVFIIQGQALVKKNGKTINRLKKGDFFGEISLIDGKPRTASVVADTDGAILVIHFKAFKKLLNTVPGLSQKMLAALCYYLRRTEASLK